MVPAVYFRLAKPPRLPTGKVNRSELIELAMEKASQALIDHESGYTLPQTKTEHIVSKIWADVLGMRRVGTSNSFLELGGHSLLAMRVISRIVIALQVEVPMQKMFDDPTVADLALYLDEVIAKNKDSGLSINRFQFDEGEV